VAPSRSLDELRARVGTPSFTPSQRDLDRLFELLADRDDEIARAAERSLARLGTRALAAARERFAASEAPLRARLCALVARLAAELHDRVTLDWLAARLDDDDSKTRHRAARALGAAGGTDAERALLGAWERTTNVADRRALARALGNAGGRSALEALVRDGSSGDERLASVVAEAVGKIERTLLRSTRSSIDADADVEPGLDVVLHVRAGLEGFLADELPRDFDARPSGRGRMAVRLTGPLSRLWSARTFLHFGFPLPPEPIHGTDGPDAAVARALASDDAWRVFSSLTKGPLRYRVEWADAGHRRSGTRRVAQAVRIPRPELVNDSKDAPWEAVVSVRRMHGEAHVLVELWPRALDDPRFAYRKRALPASSHPTVAAALARAAGVRADDVVWDPFAGAGTELIERALLGPYAKMYGSDADEAAIAAARENLAAAGVARCRLEVADLRAYRPPQRPSLIVTNPPFGRRVARRNEVSRLYEALFHGAKECLRPDGRLLWISPLPDLTVGMAERAGFAVTLRRPIDLGGLDVEMQAFERGTAGARPSGEGHSRKAPRTRRRAARADGTFVPRGSRRSSRS
jgi:hypothetical protein